MELMPVTLAGEAVELHADRALFWPARARLVIADLHLGKGDIFRRHGIAVPSGGTGGDRARLDALIARTGAAELWVLGDMLHGDPAGSRWRAAWSAFRAAHRDLAIRVIAGNHDRALHAAALDVAIDAAAVRDGPFEFRHAPATRPGAHVLCGHLHPVLRLAPLRRQFPAFVLDPDTTILPAFSLFTGGWPADPRTDAVVACVDGALVPVAPPSHPRP